MRLGLTAAFTVLLCVVGVQGKPNQKLQVLESNAKTYLGSNQKVMSIDRVDTNGIMYAASVFMTIHVPFAPAVKTILDFDNWPDVFHNVTSMKRVPAALAARCGERKICYYADAKYSFVRGWGMGVLDTVDFLPGRSVMVRVKPVSEPLFKTYKGFVAGKIPYNVRALTVEGNLIRLNDRECRIGIFAYASVNKQIPTWLLEGLMRVVMPGFVGDFEKYVEREERRKQTRH